MKIIATFFLIIFVLSSCGKKSEPLMWKDIFIDNSDNILKVLDNYSKNLEEIKDAIKNKDSKKLLEIFSSTKKVRKEIIEAGQDTDKPGFGRN